MSRSLFLTVACLASCAAPAPRENVSSFEDRLLAVLPEGADDRTGVAFSRDGRHVAYVERSPDGCRAVNGSWRSPPLDAL